MDLDPNKGHEDTEDPRSLITNHLSQPKK